MDKVTIKNISSATIVLSFNDLKFRRDLTPGRTVTVDRDTYDEMSFDPGFSSMVDEHYLAISGLEDDELSPAANAPAYDVEAIKRMFDTLDITAFARMIPTAAPAEKETIVQVAIDKKVTNNAFVALIKKYCDVDIISAINMRHLAEEE